MGNFFQKQGQRLLNDPAYAYFLTALLAVLPLTDWLSLSVIALVTLRKGYWPGLKLLLLGLSLGLAVNFWRAVLPQEVYSLVFTFTLGYLAAIFLKAWANWTRLLSALLLVGIVIVVGIHALTPEAIQAQFEALMKVFQSTQGAELTFRIPGLSELAKHPIMANYLLGIQALGVVVSALCSLAMARNIQAGLYYPGGFRKEFLAFRATPLGIALLICSMLGAYLHYAVMISILPMLLVYAMMAGMVVFFQVLFKKKDRIAMLIMLLPLIVVPYVMMPIYVCLGSLDSWFDFRRRLPSRVGE